jgi:hypothetical protein
VQPVSALLIGPALAVVQLQYIQSSLISTSYVLLGSDSLVSLLLTPQFFLVSRSYTECIV